MRENKLKTKWAAGEAALNGWLHIPSSVSAEAMAHAGFDSLTLDLQHGLLDYGAALSMLQAISTTDVVPLARVPWNEPGIIMKLLDAGCYGVICPMVNTAEACDAFVGACRYPPRGYRSYGPTRARLYGGEDYAQRANETVLAIAMIETKEALENLEDIVAVPGLDAVYVGPADLSQSLGGPPGADFEDGPVPEALARILEVATQHGVVAGLHNGSSAYAGRMVAQGFRFVTVQSDLQFLMAGAKAVLGSVDLALRPSPY
jgi:4-hydroxy-2-oxoheptanedioate aldolase